MCESVPQGMKQFRQKYMRHDDVMALGGGDAGDHFHDGDMMCGIVKWMRAAVVKPRTVDHTEVAAPATFGEIIETLDMVHGMSQMLHRTS